MGQHAAGYGRRNAGICEYDYLIGGLYHANNTKRGDPRMTRTHARQEARGEAVELRQYSQLLQAVQRAARAYQRRTGSRIDWTYTTPEDLAADTYIIAVDAPTRPGDRPGDKLRRAAYEAVRRAARAQKRHHHKDLPEEDGPGAPAYCMDIAGGIATRDAIQQAGPVAALLAQGLTPSDIARRLSVSRSTAWRLAERAREQIRAALA